MITEDYVSFETAKLLKEKGFDGILPFIYVDTEKSDRKVHLLDTLSNYNDGHIENVISAPTLQMAMKWLRNTFHLEIYPFHGAIQEMNDWWYTIEHHYKGCSLTKNESDAIYKTYEESCEAAIKYCLENLI